MTPGEAANLMRHWPCRTRAGHCCRTATGVVLLALVGLPLLPLVVAGILVTWLEDGPDPVTGLHGEALRRFCLGDH